MTVETPVSERLLALFCHDRVGGEVYIVSSGEYENNHIEAVFSSKENADEYIRLTSNTAPRSGGGLNRPLRNGLWTPFK